MDHIQHKCLKLVAIWFLWLHKFCFFIDIWNFLLYNMGWHRTIQNVCQCFYIKKIIQNNSIVIQQVALVISGVNDLVCHFIIFYNRWSAIFQAKYADSFIRICLGYYLGSAHSACLQSSSHKDRVSHFLKNIIYCKHI